MELIEGPGKVAVKLRVNGSVYNLFIEPRRTLLSVLRDELFLTGTKKVCDQGECGACSVIIDAEAVQIAQALPVKLTSATALSASFRYTLMRSPHSGLYPSAWR